MIFLLSLFHRWLIWLHQCVNDSARRTDALKTATSWRGRSPSRWAMALTGQVWTASVSEKAAARWTSAQQLIIQRQWRMWLPAARLKCSWWLWIKSATWKSVVSLLHLGPREWITQFYFSLSSHSWKFACSPGRWSSEFSNLWTMLEDRILTKCFFWPFHRIEQKM